MQLSALSWVVAEEAIGKVYQRLEVLVVDDRARRVERIASQRIHADKRRGRAGWIAGWTFSQIEQDGED